MRNACLALFFAMLVSPVPAWADPDAPISIVLTLGLHDRAGADAPLASDIQATKDFLVAQGFEKIDQPTATTVAAVGTVAIAEHAFQVRINHFVDQGRAVFANDRDPVLPPNLASIIVHIAGLDNRTVDAGAQTELATEVVPKNIAPMTFPGALDSVTAVAHLNYYGGPVISHVKTIQVLYGAGIYGAGVAGGGLTHFTKLGDFYAAMTNHAYMDWLCEYNTNITAQGGGPGTNQTIGRGSFVATYTITPAPVNNGSTITDAQIQAELNAQITAAQLPAPDGDTIYMINFPSGKTITANGGTSCVQFCGYHGTFVRSGQNVYYAVLPEFTGTGCASGCGADPTLFNNLTSTASHEVIETVTDAAIGLTSTIGPPLAWYDSICDLPGCAGHGEIGDICNQQHASILGSDSVTYIVQREWSNLSVACIAQKANTAPVALCHNVTINVNACSAAASIDNGSYDPDCWDTIQKTQFPAGPYEALTTPVTLTVTDSAGLTSTCTANVIVVSTGCDDGNACTANDTCQTTAAVQQNFDGVAAPALPAGWVSTVTAGTNPWTTTTAFSLSPPNAATTDTPLSISNKTLDTPPFVAGTASVLEFENKYNLESSFDGAVLEIKIGAGPFTDIVGAGGSFVSGGYNATISTGFASPIGGRAAWSAVSAGFVHTKINLPAAAFGQTVILRFRVASDSSAAAASPNGQWVDNVLITSPAVCQPGTTVNCDDANVCTDDSCNAASGCVHTNNTNACDDGNACTVGDTCRGGLCSGGTTAPVEYIVNGGFEAGTGVTTCDSNPFQRDSWTGTGSAIQHAACGWTGPSITVSLGYPAGNSPGTISQTFAATPGPGTLSYQHGTPFGGSCSYTVTFGPSNTVVAVTNVLLPAALANASTVAVPAGTTSVTFGNAACVGNTLVEFDNVSLMAGAATVVDCNDLNVCTDDSCDPAAGCVHANNTGFCNDGNHCTVLDTCRGGVCGGGTSAPVERLVNNGFETGAGATDCSANAFQRDSWTGTGSAIQHSGCGWTGAGITVSLGFPAGNSPGTISQTFAATPGPGTLSYQHGTPFGGSCSYTVTFGPSNTVVPVNAALPSGLIAAATIAVPAGTTSITFDNVACSGGSFLQLDNVSLTAGVSAFLDCNDLNVCTDDTCDPATGCVNTNNLSACNDGNVCTVGDSCRGGVCGGGTLDPVEDLANNGFETGGGVLNCGPNPFVRDFWTGTGSAIQVAGCSWTPSGVVASLGYPGGNTPGTISQTFPPTRGPGTLSYQHGSDAPTSCSYTVTFGPSNTVVPVNLQLPAGLIAAATIAVPAGTTSVTFGNPNCTGGANNLLQFDNVSLTAGVATFLDCNDSNICTNDSCTPGTGCVHTNNTSSCSSGNPCTINDTCAGGVCIAGTPISAPPETHNVLAANKTTYNWSVAANATQYDVVRGSIGSLPVGPGGGDEVCFDNLPGTTMTDLALPGTGAGFFYLSRGENSCGNGTFGTQGVHGVPGALRVTTTCP